jgi:hypothetical protein
VEAFLISGSRKQSARKVHTDESDWLDLAMPSSVCWEITLPSEWWRHLIACTNIEVKIAFKTQTQKTARIGRRCGASDDSMALPISTASHNMAQRNSGDPLGPSKSWTSVSPRRQCAPCAPSPPSAPLKISRLYSPVLRYSVAGTPRHRPQQSNLNRPRRRTTYPPRLSWPLSRRSCRRIIK